jgi:hypothetical protein
MVYWSGGAEAVLNTTKVWSYWDAGRDVSYLYTSGTEVGSYWNGSQYVNVNFSTLRANQLNHYVCHYGSASGNSCGYVTATNYAPSPGPANCNAAACTNTYVRVTGGFVTCAGGDSGGPWFVGGFAYGIHKSGSTAGCTFSAVDDIFAQGLNLLGP